MNTLKKALMTLFAITAIVATGAITGWALTPEPAAADHCATECGFSSCQFTGIETNWQCVTGTSGFCWMEPCQHFAT
jgi:hypothetical protein